jgi:predicted transcriptional regulator
MLVAELMDQDVQVLAPTASLQEAGRLLRRPGEPVVLVQEGDRVVATVSQRDLALGGCGGGLDPAGTPLEAVMSRDPVCCSPDLGLAEARAIMHEHDADALVVCDGSGRPVGLLSRLKLLEVLSGPAFAQSRGPAPEYVHRVRGDDP